MIGPATTMAAFELCDACQREYSEPAEPALSCRAGCLPDLRPGTVISVPGSDTIQGNEAALAGLSGLIARR